ncbi:DUF222 domain-containing protein [Geodermatophilus sp. URMC 65]
MSAERWAARPEVLRAVSEWATPELAIALNLTQQAAEKELERSLTLVHRLPGTLAALEAGLLHAGHLWHLIDKVAPIADERLRAAVEADLLAWMAKRHRVTSPAQLGDKARKVVAQRDAGAAARRLARALKERGVSLRPDRAEGMAAVTVMCTLPEARAFHAALVQCADAIVDEPGAPRTRGQKMVDALLELVLRPGESELPPVRVLLTLVASVATMLGGDAPAELDGELLPAEMARRLARAFAGQPPMPDAASGEPEPVRPTAEVTLRPDVAWQEAEQAELAACWPASYPSSPSGVRTGFPATRSSTPRTRAAAGYPSRTSRARGSSCTATAVPPERRHPPPTRRRAAAGGRPPIGRWRTPVRRCTPPGSRWVTPPAACAPRPRSTPRPRPAGGRVPVGGPMPRPTRSARWPRRRTPSGSSWPTCWTPRPGVGWPTGRAWRSPTRCPGRC